MFDDLLQLPLFQGITADQLVLFAGRFPFHFETVKPNVTLITSGVVNEELFFIINGRVGKKVVISSSNITIFEEINSPYTIPPTYFYGRFNEPVATWKTISETKILRIRKQDYQKMVISNTVMLLSLLNLLSNQAQMCTQFILNNSLKDLQSRFAFTLLNLTDKEADLVFIKASRGKLCAAFGVSYTTLAKLIDQLLLDGVLETKESGFLLKDRAKLNLLLK